MSLTVYRKSHFNAAHRLYRSDWDDEKNNAVFGNVITQIFMAIIMS